MRPDLRPGPDVQFPANIGTRMSLVVAAFEINNGAAVGAIIEQLRADGYPAAAAWVTRAIAVIGFETAARTGRLTALLPDLTIMAASTGFLAELADVVRRDAAGEYASPQ